MRYALRQLFHAPGYAVVAILSLAFGIAATTAVYSVVYGVLINPYPYRGADRMVVFSLRTSTGATGMGLFVREFVELEKLDVFDGVVGMDTWPATLTGEGLPEAVQLSRISANTFEYLGIPPMLGREFTANAASYGRDPDRVAVLTYAFWQSHYGKDLRVIGKIIRLDREIYTIIGVAPPRLLWSYGDVYVPLRLADDAPAFGFEARLKPGISIQRAQAQLQPLFERFARENPKRFPPNFQVRVVKKIEAAGKDSRTALLLLELGSFFLLAVACANVSILQLARGAARSHELAVRAAVGATRRRLAGQLLAESLLLAVAGASVGIAAAWRLPAIAEYWLPRGIFPRETDIHLSFPVLVFSTAMALAAALASGIAPAVQLSLPRLAEWIQAGNRHATISRAGRRTHSPLIAFQVALTLLLLAGAGAAARSLLALQKTTLGYDPEHLLLARVPVAEGSYTTHSSRTVFFEEIRRLIAASPLIESVALLQGEGAPPHGGWREPVEIFGEPARTGAAAQIFRVTPGYFATLKIPLLHGRAWSEEEHARPARVAVINRAMEKRFWPAGNPVGQKLRFRGFRAGSFQVDVPLSNDWLEIVGVAGDVPNRGLGEPPQPAAYVPYTLVEDDSIVIVARAKDDPLAAVRPIREIVGSVDANQAVVETDTAQN
ncbi:MAG: ABC transporter permease, partial [Acidobacteriia bacterium]|nr:ABC transporter permease [Terriglobia bacterium]